MKKLIVDYNGPIIKANNFFEDRSKRIAKIFKIKYNKELRNEWVRLYIEVSEGKISLESYYKKLSKIAKTKLNGDEDKRFINCEKMADKGMPLHIRTLRKKFGSKLKIGILSNYTTSWVMGFLKKNHLEKYFDKIVVSDRIKVRKPDLRAYNAIARMLGAKPKDCVYIGDSLDDLNGAKSAGMKSIFIPGEDKEAKGYAKINNLGEVEKYLK